MLDTQNPIRIFTTLNKIVMRLERRGRKADAPLTIRPKQFVQEETDYMGVRMVQTYDFDKNPKGGIISVELFYPNDVTPIVKNPKTAKTAKISKTKQTYLNPINGKMVGYTRAKMLKLI